MKTYFLDTSAFVKRYRTEPGSGVIDAVFSETESTFMISDISVIEFYSAISMKVRSGEIQENDFAALRKRFSQDVTDGLYAVAEVGEKEKAGAVDLLIKYGKSHHLRTLDALQLSAVSKADPAKLSTVVCADARFIRVIEYEGFTCLNPLKN